MSSLVSTGNPKNIVNWVTTADGCVDTDDTTKRCRQLVANSCSQRRRRRDKTVSSRRRRRCVLGITLPERHKQTGGQTTCHGNTALCVTSRGKMYGPSLSVDSCFSAVRIPNCKR